MWKVWQSKEFKVLAALVAALSGTAVLLLNPFETRAARPIAFPIVGGGNFSNDFFAPRSSGVHHATDIFAPKMRPLVAAMDGEVSFVAFPQASWGYSLNITDDDGWTYRYIHINNDTPGTDDGLGGPMNAYAPDMKSGNRVVKGQLVGWVGDSGNAENTPSHLHFEMIAPDDGWYNPYDSLVQAPRLAAPVVHPQMPNELLPYGTSFIGGLNIDMGNFDADPDSEILTGAGRGGGPHVKVFDNDESPMGGGFYAYHPNFPGGIDVAAGDLDGDGIDEIITGAGAGGGPHVRIFEANGTPIGGGFYAYAPQFPGGVRVSAGDVDGDGNDEIITGAGAGGGPHVRVFEQNGTQVRSFFAYTPAFTGGVDVSAGDVMGDGDEEVITAPGAGGGPHVKIFDDTGAVGGFMAYAPSFSGGVRVSSGNVRTSSPEDEIVVVPQSGGAPHMRMVTVTGALIDDKTFHESWWSGFYDVGADFDESLGATGTNRRASIRDGLN